jgi:hypothetical protein
VGTSFGAGDCPAGFDDMMTCRSKPDSCQSSRVASGQHCTQVRLGMPSVCLHVASSPLGMRDAPGPCPQHCQAAWMWSE